ncbi:sensor histidine kinase [Paracoccus aminophilus]|uniref:histidine kinase n=1 Tax=Paracoccus aminophilus JCM 7686 TaxID=1367847 RepID=S5YYL3_PARAH|nr:ATP-binding protein [Paracoccus aminophilus]AGT10296.1 histidine kinase [Paracoccus aminophilus JCM 7686]
MAATDPRPAQDRPTPNRPAPNRPAPSLRRDLAVRLGLWMTALWVLALVAGWLTMRHEIDEIYDAVLKRTADRFLPLADSVEDHAGPILSSEGGGLWIQIIGADGAMRMISTTADPGIFAEPIRDGFSEAADARIFTRTSAEGTVIRVADPMAERREATLDTLSSFLIAAALMLPVNILAIFWLTRARLRPVTRFAATVADRGAQDLDPVRTPDLPQELLPVEASVNRLMARIKQALDTERAFSANAAHELRTPIAAVLAQTQRLVAEAPEGALRDRAEAIVEEEKRLARLAEKLLELTRAEGGPANHPLRDMRDIAGLVVRDFDTPVELAAMPKPVLIAMDPDHFAILLRNLIENAIRHGQPPIRVSLTPGEISVTNQGAPVPADKLPHLTQRFERAGSRKAGSGLGLAIVETLVRRAGARLQLISPLPGQSTGFAAVIRFPITS